jgi:hypothetical protein
MNRLLVLLLLLLPSLASAQFAPPLPAPGTRAPDRLNLLDYAECNGGDDTKGIDAWLAAIVSTGKSGWIPVATCRFDRPLGPLTKSGIAIQGEGPASRLLYTGASTTPGDLLMFGTGDALHQNLSLRGFAIGSATALESGTAIRIKRTVKIDIDLEISAGGNLWDGIWFDDASTIDLHSSLIYTRNTGVRANGGAKQASELHFNHAWIAGSRTGRPMGISIHLAGNFGGVYTENLIQQNNDIGMLIDNAVRPEANLQLFFGAVTVFDGNYTAAVKVDDKGVNPVSKYILADAMFASSSHGDGFVIVNYTGGHFRTSAGAFIANGLHSRNSAAGLVIDDPTVQVVIGKTVDFAYNYGWGIKAARPVTVDSAAAAPRRNTIAAYHSNVTVVNRLNAAAADRLDVNGHARVTSPAEGVLRLSNIAGNRFTALNLATGANSDVGMLTGIGSPEGAVAARVGSFYLRQDGGPGTTFYVKERGTGNTGWAAK